MKVVTRKTTESYVVELEEADLIQLLRDKGFDCPQNGVSLTVSVPYDDWAMDDCCIVASWSTQEENTDLTSLDS